jgi:hypothetical protein
MRSLRGMLCWRETAKGLTALAAAGVIGVTAGLAVQPPAVAAPGTAAAGPAGTGSASAAVTWRARTVVKLGSRLASLAVSPQAGAAYELLARNKFGQGPFRLERISLATRAVRRGPAFPVSDVAVAAGYLWVSGDTGSGSSAFRPVLYQVNPATLAVLRSWRLTTRPTSDFAEITVAAGPAGTAWVGFLRTLWRLNPGTGTVLRRVRLAAGLSAVDIAVDPAARHLYVAARENKTGGVLPLEYTAGSGRLIARSARTALRFSAGGAQLTAVPSGVWASFRTGMLGQTVLLRQGGLRTVRLPSAGRGLYGWAMNASTVYGGGSLWLNSGVQGRIACVGPGTGRIRASGTLKALDNGIGLLAVSPSARKVFALGGSGLLAITAPGSCWQ